MTNLVKGIVISVSVIAIILMSTLVYINGDTWFTSMAEIEYPNGCVEKYKGTELITSECTQGRQIAQDIKDGKRITVDRYTKSLNETVSLLQWNLSI